MCFIMTKLNKALKQACLLSFTLLFSFPFAFADNFPTTDHIVSGEVTYVVDGDTLDVDKTRVRLWGINTPERGEAGYEDAKEFLKNITLNATLKCMAFYYDRWKRTVASCEVNGQDIGRIMVLAGMAEDYTRYSKGFYAKDQEQAKIERRGFWQFSP